MADSFSDDLLYLIFQKCLPTVVHAKAPANSLEGIRSLSPLNFSLVCRSWRATVQSHPSLWGSINFYDRRGSYSEHLPLQPIDFILEEWLRRSTNAPLNISFDLLETSCDNDLLTYRLLDLVSYEYHRWREMSFFVHHTDFEKSVILKCNPSLKRLISNFGLPVVLDLSSCAMMDEDKTKSQLEELTIASPMQWIFPERKRDLFLPRLDTISFFTADVGRSLEDILAVFSACPKLSSASLRVQGVAGGESEARIESLRNLKELSLQSWNRVTTLQLLNHLCCPSLTSFMYSVYFTSTAPPGERDGMITAHHLRTFTTFFTRSRSHIGAHLPLKSLRLVFIRGSIGHQSHFENARALEELLRCLDSLELLDLSGCFLDNGFVQNLTLRAAERGREEGTGALCRSLKELSLRCHDTHVLEKKNVEDLIVSRWTSGDSRTRLRMIALEVRGFQNFGSENLAVRRCIEEGLVLKLFQT